MNLSNCFYISFPILWCSNDLTNLIILDNLALWQFQICDSFIGGLSGLNYSFIKLSPIHFLISLCYIFTYLKNIGLFPYGPVLFPEQWSSLLLLSAYFLILQSPFWGNLWPSWAMTKKNVMPAMWRDVVLQRSYTATDHREQFSVICDKEQGTKTSWHQLKQWSHLSVKFCQAHSVSIIFYLFLVLTLLLLNTHAVSRWQRSWNYLWNSACM